MGTKVKLTCKNCGNTTNFRKDCTPERKEKGWCTPCFNKSKDTRRPCKNCNEVAFFQRGCLPERKQKGWCTPCFRTWRRGLKTDNNGNKFWKDDEYRDVEPKKEQWQFNKKKKKRANSNRN